MRAPALQSRAAFFFLHKISYEIRVRCSLLKSLMQNFVVFASCIFFIASDFIFAEA